MKLALIGVGTMGQRIGSSLLEAGHELGAFDVRADAAAVLADQGARVLRSAEETAAETDVCLLSLPTPEVVSEVVDGLLASATPPALIADLSTVDPDTTRRLWANAVDRRVGYIDAPVLGRPDRCGAWTIAAGGSEADVEAARPALEALAARIVRVGPPGSGNALKLLNNVMFGAINAVTAECVAAAGPVGLDPKVFVDVVASSNAATVSNLFRELAPKMVAQDFSPAFSIELLAKDLQLALGMLRTHGFDPVVTPTVAQLTDAGAARGLEALDTSALVRLFEPS